MCARIKKKYARIKKMTPESRNEARIKDVIPE